MALSPNLVPMRWPSGPLEAGRLRTRQELTPQTREVLELWHDPASLDLLKGSPVNCLLLSWADGSAEDAEQQKTAQPLVRAALERGLAVIGWVEGSARKEAAIAAAKSAGLSAVAVRDFDGKSEVALIPWGDRAGAPWDSKAPVLPITGNVWPGVQGTTGGSDATAGPTGLPWLDTNGWFIQLARARFAGPVWMLYDPPGKGAVILPQRYAIAISDSEAAGARWVVSLDESLRAGLTGGNAAARGTWETISNTLAFFERHREWRAYRPLGVVGVVSDYRDGNFELSGEILNLMARRDLLFRVIWKSQALAQPFDGLKALVYADSEQPPAELRRKMLTFVEQGGLLITGPKWGAEGKSTGHPHARFDLRALGRGRLAVAKGELSDPYEIASDTQFLLSHANDVVKLFNASASGGFHYSGSADGKRSLLQLLIYAAGRAASQNMTVWTRRMYRRARLWSLEAAEPVPLERVDSESGGVEFRVPALQAGYFAVEFEA